jgi:hypothetical protein
LFDCIKTVVHKYKWKLQVISIIETSWLSQNLIMHFNLKQEIFILFALCNFHLYWHIKFFLITTETFIKTFIKGQGSILLLLSNMGLMNRCDTTKELCHAGL